MAPTSETSNAHREPARKTGFPDEKLAAAVFEISFYGEEELEQSARDHESSRDASSTQSAARSVTSESGE